MHSRKRLPTVQLWFQIELLFRDVLPAVPNRSPAVTTFGPLAGDRYKPEQKLGGPRSSPQRRAFLEPRPLLAACLRCRLSKRPDRIADTTGKEPPFFARRSSEARLQLLPSGRGKQGCRQGGSIQCKSLEQAP